MSAALFAGMLLLALQLACTPAEQRARLAREAIDRAAERGDRAGALAALSDLRAALPDTADALLELARAQVRVGSAPEAVWVLESGVRRYPDRHDLRVALAHVALLLANPALALEAARAVPPESEHHAAALLARAHAVLALGDLEAALRLLEQAEQLYPDRPEVRMARIATLVRERRRDAARDAILEFQQHLAGGDHAARQLARRFEITLAQLRAHDGEPEAALASLDALVVAHPTDLDAWQALVQLLLQLRRAQEARLRLEDALSGEQPPLALYPTLARLHEELGDPARAEQTLREYVSRAQSAGAFLPLVVYYGERDDAPAAIAVLDQAIERHPDESALHLLRIESLLADGRVGAAREAAERFRATTFAGDPQIDYLQARFDLAEGRARDAAERLTALAPHLDRAPTQFWLGRALELTGNRDGAQRRYALALRLDPHWSAPAARLIAIARAHSDWRSMAAYARTWVRHAPARFEAWESLVEALTQLGEGDEAAVVAERALARHPERPEAHLLLARARRAQRRFDEAFAALAAAERGGAGDLAAERVLTLGMAGRLEEGVALAERVCAADPERPDVYAAAASLLYAMGRADEGDVATERALALAPASPRPLRVRCEFRAASGRLAGAREDCERYLAARPDDIEAHFVLGVVKAGSGDADGAIASYERASALAPADQRPRNNLAGLLAERGDLDAALAQAQEAYRLAPADPRVADTLATLYLRKGLAPRAVALFEQAYAAAPDAPAVAIALALAYHEAGRSDDARPLLARLQKEAANDPALRARVEEAIHSLH